MSALSPYNENNPYWVGAYDNPYDINHACYPYRGIFNEATCGHRFPADPDNLYHCDNVNNPYHPDNVNHIILKNGAVLNTENPYNPDSPLNPYHPDNPYKVDTTPCDDATKEEWIGNIYKPCHPDNPFVPPQTESPPIQPCAIKFSLVARSAADSRAGTAYKPYQTESDTTLQVLPNRMQTLLIEDIFKFRQQFLEETPDIHTFDSTETQTYCAEPVIPDSEQLTLVVDNTSGIFHIPVGGLSSSGSECLYDWDIWIDHRYSGRYIGYSGLRTEGIELQLKSESHKTAPTVTAFPNYTRFNNEKDVNIDIQVLADGGWNYIPFWIRLDAGGILLEKSLGIFNELFTVSGLKLNSPNADNTVIKIRNKLDVHISDWLMQGFLFYPNRPLNDCAIEVCLIDVRHSMYFYNDITLGSRPESVNEIHCLEPAFTLSSGRIQFNASSNLNYHAKCALENFVNEITDAVTEPPEPTPPPVFDTTLTFGVRIVPPPKPPHENTVINIGERPIEEKEDNGTGGGSSGGGLPTLTSTVTGWNKGNGKYVSDNHSHGSTSTPCVVTYSTTASKIYINVESSSEQNYDWVIVRDPNGLELGRISGITQVSYEYGTSVNRTGTLTILYQKDGSVDANADEGYFYSVSIDPMFTVSSGGGGGNGYNTPPYSGLEALPKGNVFALTHSANCYDPANAYDASYNSAYYDYDGFWGIDFMQNTLGIKSGIPIRRIEIEGYSGYEFRLFYTGSDDMEHELPITWDRYGYWNYIYVWTGEVTAKSIRIDSNGYYGNIDEVTVYAPEGFLSDLDTTQRGCVLFAAEVSSIQQLGRVSRLKPIVEKPNCDPPTFQLGIMQRYALRDSLLSSSEQKKAQCHWHPLEEGKSVITIRPYYASKGWHGWLRAFGFHHSSPELWNTSENKDKLLEISVGITPAMIADSPSDAGNYCMRYWLYGCRNVKPGREFRFTGWDDVERAGHGFLFKAFYGCDAFDFLPLDYEEPKFKIVGNNYKAYKCYECRNLKDVGLKLTAPPVEISGDAHEAFEYYGCEKLQRLPDNYTESQLLTCPNMADHQIYKFALCQSLYTLPFNYKESPLVHVHDNYHAYKFSGSGLRILPMHYSEALSLTFIGKNCCTSKFKDCGMLAGLPTDYTELNPVNMGINFIKNKFSGCVSLIVNNNYKFPLLTAEMLEKSGVLAGVFAIVGGLLQDMTANGIINGNSTPPEHRGVFSGIFADYETLNENWKS